MSENFDFIWDHELPDGNVPHIEQHGVTPDEVEEAFEDVLERTISRSSGRPALFGVTLGGRVLFVVYTEFEGMIYVHTAYEGDEE